MKKKDIKEHNLRVMKIESELVDHLREHLE